MRALQRRQSPVRGKRSEQSSEYAQSAYDHPCIRKNMAFGPTSILSNLVNSAYTAFGSDISEFSTVCTKPSTLSARGLPFGPDTRRGLPPPSTYDFRHWVWRLIEVIMEPPFRPRDGLIHGSDESSIVWRIVSMPAGGAPGRDVMFMLLGLIRTTRNSR